MQELHEAMLPRRWILGLKRDECQEAMEEWLHRGAPVAVKIQRAKTIGMVCMTIDIDPKEVPEGVYFVRYLQQRFPNMKVNINPPLKPAVNTTGTKANDNDNENDNHAQSNKQ